MKGPSGDAVTDRCTYWYSSNTAPLNQDGGIWRVSDNYAYCSHNLTFTSSCFCCQHLRAGDRRGPSFCIDETHVYWRLTEVTTSKSTQSWCSDISYCIVLVRTMSPFIIICLYSSLLFLYFTHPFPVPAHRS